MSVYTRRPAPAPAPLPRPGEAGFIGPPDVRPAAGPTSSANGTTPASAAPFLNMYDPGCGPTTFSAEGDLRQLYTCHNDLRVIPPRVADGPSISAGSGGGRPLTPDEQRLVSAGLPLVPPEIQALRALGRDAGPLSTLVNGVDSLRGDVRTERILSNQRQLAPVDALLGCVPVPHPTVSETPPPQTSSVQSGPPSSPTYHGPPGAGGRPRAGDPIMSLPPTGITASEMLAHQSRLGGIETSASRAPGATDGVLVRGTSDGVTPPRGNVQFAHSHPGAAEDPRLELPSPPDIMGARRHGNRQAIVHDNGVSVFNGNTQVSEIPGMVGEHGSQVDVARRVNNVTVVPTHDVTISQEGNNVCLNPPNPTAEGAHLPIRIVQGDTYAPGTSRENVERLRRHQQQR